MNSRRKKVKKSEERFNAQIEELDALIDDITFLLREPGSKLCQSDRHFFAERKIELQANKKLIQGEQ